MPVISFATSKGGAGKTTSTIVLGTELAEATDVIIIDADPAKRDALAPLGRLQDHGIVGKAVPLSRPGQASAQQLLPMGPVRVIEIQEDMA